MVDKAAAMINRFTRRGEVRPQDLPHYKLIEKNRPVIHGLINHLTGGGLSSAQQEPQAQERESTKTFHIGRATKANEPGRPIVNISFNGRVLIIDDARAKQLMHLGNLVRGEDGTKFLLANKKNGFFAPVDGAIQEVLEDLDGRFITNEFTEEDLSKEVSARLSLDDV